MRGLWRLRESGAGGRRWGSRLGCPMPRAKLQAAQVPLPAIDRHLNGRSGAHSQPACSTALAVQRVAALGAQRDSRALVTAADHR